ncbi:HAD family hydrolase [Deinococcus hohokamensis]|uniref:HAD family hydrolase n=1 Tax=Deinococcus hohokamensis TaxID=309883 RepID=A0ABV9IC25_9DEIO
MTGVRRGVAAAPPHPAPEALSGIRTVLFDLDGTLHDRTATLRRWLAAHVRSFGLPPGYAGRFLAQDDFGYRPKSLVFPALIEEFGLTLTAEVLMADYERALDHAQVMPHAHEVLVALRQRGLRLGIVTNGWVEAQTVCVRHCGLSELVDDVVISRAVGLSKPDCRIFHLALERLGGAAPTSLFVGDSPRNDIQGAQEAGLRAAYLGTGHPLGSVRPDWVLNDLRDLLGLQGRQKAQDLSGQGRC